MPRCSFNNLLDVNHKLKKLLVFFITKQLSGYTYCSANLQCLVLYNSRSYTIINKYTNVKINAVVKYPVNNFAVCLNTV